MVRCTEKWMTMEAVQNHMVYSRLVLFSKSTRLLVKSSFRCCLVPTVYETAFVSTNGMNTSTIVGTDGARTNSATSNTAPPIVTTQIRTKKDRASARNQVAQQWAMRRQSASERERERPGASTVNATIDSASATSSQKKASSPKNALSNNLHQQPIASLCYIIGKAWQEAVMGLSKQEQSPAVKASPSSSSLMTMNNMSTVGASKKEKGKTNLQSFPSVLQILQANALHQQVEHFHQGNDNNSHYHVSSNTSSVDGTALKAGPSDSSQHSSAALRVLPKGYDWNQAILNMAQSRSRAFLLLDLASIVPTLVQWKRQTTGCNVHFLYTVQYNADPKLLQLLLRSHVGLVCTNKWDLMRCQQAIQETYSLCSSRPSSSSSLYSLGQETQQQQQQIPLYDNANTTGKPDGYLRQLVLDAQMDTVVVDGPDEVTRIVHSLRRLQQRRSSSKNRDPIQVLHFILRLSSAEKDRHGNDWQELLESTQQQIQESETLTLSVQKVVLAGLSVDIGYATSDTYEKIEQLLQQLKSFGEITVPVRLDLTGVSMPPNPEMLDWWKRLGSSHKITVDVSHALISPAGALCTRIIGVKEEEDDTTGTVKRHYYIDDGCYGSLYTCSSTTGSSTNNSSRISNPLPLLYGNKERSKNSQTQQQAEKVMFTSTVWGPTCDGLDKVSDNIPLPKLHRDQWLVFPNLGCRIGEGLGTAFNGFAPPDTAYCVLGYFGK